MLKSDYRAPEVNYPINWTKGDVDGNTSPFDWEEFNDPNLDNWLHLVMTRALLQIVGGDKLIIPFC